MPFTCKGRTSAKCLALFLQYSMLHVRQEYTVTSCLRTMSQATVLSGTYENLPFPLWKITLTVSRLRDLVLPSWHWSSIYHATAVKFPEPWASDYERRLEIRLFWTPVLASWAQYPGVSWQTEHFQLNQPCRPLNWLFPTTLVKLLGNFYRIKL